MIENHNHYELKKVKIDDLILDTTNPRLWELIVDSDTGEITQNMISGYLNKHEKLSILKKKIEVNGWRPPDDPWVIEIDGKYIVKEGNRRVAVLKILERQLDFDTINVKVYNDVNIIHNMMEEHHVDGPEKWDPIANGIHQMQQNKKSKIANLVEFCLVNKVTSLFDTPGAFTIIKECLKKSNSGSTLGCFLDDAKLEYQKIGAKNVVLIINEIVKAYTRENEPLNTRNRGLIPAELQKIKMLLKPFNPSPYGQPQIGIDDLFKNKPDNDSSENASSSTVNVGTKENGKSESDRMIPRRFPDNINEQNINEFLNKLTETYTTTTRGNISYLLLIDMKKEKIYNNKVVMCRMILDAMLSEYYSENPKELKELTLELKRKDTDPLEIKSTSISNTYIDKLKNEFPDEKNIDQKVKNIKSVLSIMHDCIHGKIYYSTNNQFFTTFINLYPILFLLSRILNKQ